jgi:hypothetical protein
MEMKELYEAKNKLEIVHIRATSIVDSDEAKLKVIDDLSALLNENEIIYIDLKRQASELKKEIKILELVYFCQNGRYPDEQN